MSLITIPILKHPEVWKWISSGAKRNYTQGNFGIGSAAPEHLCSMEPPQKNEGALQVWIQVPSKKIL